jgi:protein involved in polysaccharide export with SLBB domain
MAAGLLVGLLVTSCMGCVAHEFCCADPLNDIPRELAKVNLPEYVIEPPDILLINAVRIVPLPPYRLEPFDSVSVQVISSGPAADYTLQSGDQVFIQVKADELPAMRPIAGAFPIDPEGKVSLGFDYGSVPIAGLTVPKAKEAITNHLKTRFNITEIQFALAESAGLQTIAGPYTIDVEGKLNLGPAYGNVHVAGMSIQEAEQAVANLIRVVLRDPKVSLSLVQSRGLQQIQGEHLVRPDGTIYLGTYGFVRVAGMTLTDAKYAIEAHLTQFLQDPEITLDVGYFSSKFYYVITDGAGNGEQVYRFNITGNETVLDAMYQIGGLPSVASKHHIWVARPAPCELNCMQILPVDWNGIARKGAVCTNYQLMPGDRVYVQSDFLVSFDTLLAKVISPVERMFGIALLARTTITQYEIGAQQFGGGNGGGGLFFP